MAVTNDHKIYIPEFNLVESPIVVFILYPKSYIIWVPLFWNGAYFIFVHKGLNYADNQILKNALECCLEITQRIKWLVASIKWS